VEIAVFCDVMLCSLVDRYQSTRTHVPESSNLRNPENLKSNIYKAEEHITELKTYYKAVYLHFKLKHIIHESRGSLVGIATGYKLDDRGVGVRVPVGSRMFTSPCRRDRLWGPPNFLYNW
jgi:hypothetical protein